MHGRALIVYRRYVGSLARKVEAERGLQVVGRLFGRHDRDLPATIEALDAHPPPDARRRSAVRYHRARRRARKIVLEPRAPLAVPTTRGDRQLRDDRAAV
jgi:hypothetical protein